MRLEIEMHLKNQVIPIDYRRCFISMLKKGLTEYEEGKYFNEFFGSLKEKQYTFSIRFPKVTFFEEDFIILSKPKLWMTVSTGDIRTGIIINNALLKVKGLTYPFPNGNELLISKLTPLIEPFVTENKIAIKFLAPVCLREHFKTGEIKDIYHTITESDFEDYFAASVNKQMGFETGIKIIPLQMKEVFVKHYGVVIPCSIGTAVLSADKDTLQHLALTGVGSRRGSGFGLFRILNNEEVQDLCKKFV